MRIGDISPCRKSKHPETKCADGHLIRDDGLVPSRGKSSPSKLILLVLNALIMLTFSHAVPPDQARVCWILPYVALVRTATLVFTRMPKNFLLPNARRG